MKKAIVLIGYLFVLSACNKLKEGKIIEHQYVPGFFQYTTIVDDKGKSIPGPLIWHPEYYCFKIAGVYNGHVRTEVVEVPSDVYMKKKDGEMYKIPE